MNTHKHPTATEGTHSSDVLIVGAGPTGLMLAALLSRWGITPRIIDTASGLSQFSKATGVQARSLEIFEQLGLADDAVTQGLPSSAVNLFNDGDKLGRVPFGDAGQGVSPYPYILILPQDRTEAILGGDLERHGVHIEWNTRLEDFTQSDAGVEATLSHDGQSEHAHFRYLLGADGARSTVREGAGVTFQGDSFEHRFFVADLRIEGRPAEGELNIFLSNHFKFVAMFPMKGERRFRLVGIVPDAYQHLDKPTFEDMQPHLEAAMGDLMRFSEVAWFATYRVHHLVAEQFKKGRVFLAGDAAHVHSPVGGQGMNTGLQDAYNLAWKLALVLRGAADESVLESYHEERHPNAVALVNSTDRVFSGFIASTGGVAGFVRRWVLPLVVPTLLPTKLAQSQMYGVLSQTSLNYRGRRLSVGSKRGAFRAGDRFPWFEVDGRDVYDYLSPARFTLFVLGEAAQQSELRALPTGVLEPISLTDPKAYKAAGLSDGFYLVRPDGYIGTASTNLEDIHAYLSQTVGLRGLSSARTTEPVQQLAV